MVRPRVGTQDWKSNPVYGSLPSRVLEFLEPARASQHDHRRAKLARGAFAKAAFRRRARTNNESSPSTERASGAEASTENEGEGLWYALPQGNDFRAVTAAKLLTTAARAEPVAVEPLV